MKSESIGADDLKRALDELKNIENQLVAIFAHKTSHNGHDIPSQILEQKYEQSLRKRFSALKQDLPFNQEVWRSYDTTVLAQKLAANENRLQYYQDIQQVVQEAKKLVEYLPLHPKQLDEIVSLRAQADQHLSTMETEMRRPEPMTQARLEKIGTMLNMTPYRNTMFALMGYDKRVKIADRDDLDKRHWAISKSYNEMKKSMTSTVSQSESIEEKAGFDTTPFKKVLQQLKSRETQLNNAINQTLPIKEGETPVSLFTETYKVSLKERLSALKSALNLDENEAWQQNNMEAVANEMAAMVDTKTYLGVDEIPSYKAIKSAVGKADRLLEEVSEPQRHVARIAEARQKGLGILSKAEGNLKAKQFGAARKQLEGPDYRTAVVDLMQHGDIHKIAALSELHQQSIALREEVKQAYSEVRRSTQEGAAQKENTIHDFKRNYRSVQGGSRQSNILQERAKAKANARAKLKDLKEKSSRAFSAFSKLKGDLPNNILFQSKSTEDIISQLVIIDSLKKHKSFKTLQRDPDGILLKLLMLSKGNFSIASASYNGIMLLQEKAPEGIKKLINRAVLGAKDMKDLIGAVSVIDSLGSEVKLDRAIKNSNMITMKLNTLAKTDLDSAESHFNKLMDLKEQSPDAFKKLTSFKGDLPTNILFKSNSVDDIIQKVDQIGKIKNSKVLESLQRDPDGSKLALTDIVAKINPKRIPLAQKHSDPAALLEALQKVEQAYGEVADLRLEVLAKAEDPLKVADSMIEARAPLTPPPGGFSR